MLRQFYTANQFEMRTSGEAGGGIKSKKIEDVINGSSLGERVRSRNSSSQLNSRRIYPSESAREQFPSREHTALHWSHLESLMAVLRQERLENISFITHLKW